MAKKTQTPVLTKMEEIVAPTPVDAAEKPVISKSAKKRASKKEALATAVVDVAEVEVAAIIVDAAPIMTDENVIIATDSTGLAETFSEFMAKFQSLVAQMTSLKTEFRALEKKSIREIKIAQKLNAKRKRKAGNRAPSGFVKPTLISAELAKFLNKPNGTEMARTEVTREINGYIRTNSLQDKTNGRKINPDKSLATLLKIQNGEELTYFNLQRYMSPHFAKAGSAFEAVGSVV